MIKFRNNPQDFAFRHTDPWPDVPFDDDHDWRSAALKTFFKVLVIVVLVMVALSTSGKP